MADYDAKWLNMCRWTANKVKALHSICSGGLLWCACQEKAAPATGETLSSYLSRPLPRPNIS
jgi:hypothetical protein